MSKDGNRSFEDELHELEAVVNRLEEGGLSLDESIDLYEKGVKLAAACQEKLDKAQLRISQLRESYIREEPAAYETDPVDDGEVDV
jgi:exodeoxyribonuclease VII small subunit